MLQIKKNHIFLCNNNGSRLIIWQQSWRAQGDNSQSKSWIFEAAAELKSYSDSVLVPIKCVRLNPYKIVEMWKNYRPNILLEFQSNELYAEPSAEVKDKKSNWSEFRAALKAKMYAEKLQVKSLTFDDGCMDGWCFYSRWGVFPLIDYYQSDHSKMWLFISIIIWFDFTWNQTLRRRCLSGWIFYIPPKGLMFPYR